jgi:hypothetical protein
MLNLPHSPMLESRGTVKSPTQPHARTQGYGHGRGPATEQIDKKKARVALTRALNKCLAVTRLRLRVSANRSSAVRPNRMARRAFKRSGGEA